MKKLILFLGLLLVPAMGYAEFIDQYQLDVQGESHFSRNNFTDRQKPYKGTDSWMEIKQSYWLDQNKTISPFLSIIPVHTSEGRFFWQRNIQLAYGLQWYPFYAMNTVEFVKSIRLFAEYATRDYYDKPNEENNPSQNDAIAGADYYYDNLFAENPMILVVWTKLAYHTTNFAKSGYDNVLWEGDVRFGPRIGAGASIIFPYLMVNWCYSPKYNERWWENWARVGAGVRWYPRPDVSGNFLKDVIKRFYIFAEKVHNAAWLGESPDNVKKDDYRIGFGFSTSGFTRQEVY